MNNRKIASLHGAVVACLALIASPIPASAQTANTTTCPDPDGDHTAAHREPTVLYGLPYKITETGANKAPRFWVPPVRLVNKGGELHYDVSKVSDDNGNTVKWSEPTIVKATSPEFTKLSVLKVRNRISVYTNSELPNGTFAIRLTGADAQQNKLTRYTVVHVKTLLPTVLKVDPYHNGCYTVTNPNEWPDVVNEYGAPIQPNINSVRSYRWDSTREVWYSTYVRPGESKVPHSGEYKVRTFCRGVDTAPCTDADPSVYSVKVDVKQLRPHGWWFLTDSGVLRQGSSDKRSDQILEVTVTRTFADATTRVCNYTVLPGFGKDFTHDHCVIGDKPGVYNAWYTDLSGLRVRFLKSFTLS